METCRWNTKYAVFEVVGNTLYPTDAIALLTQVIARVCASCPYFRQPPVECFGPVITIADADGRIGYAGCNAAYREPITSWPAPGQESYPPYGSACKWGPEKPEPPCISQISGQQYPNTLTFSRDYALHEMD